MKWVAFVVMAAVAAPAFGQCVGSEQFKTCTDSTGNTYSVSRMGNTTLVNGSNAQTGSTWNQSTYHSPNMSVTNGTDSDGNSWNSTATSAGTYGTDSDGNSFYVPPTRRR